MLPLLLLGCFSRDLPDASVAAPVDTSGDSGEFDSGDTGTLDTSDSGTLDTGDSGDPVDTVDTTDTGDTGDTGETGETGDTRDTGHPCDGIAVDPTEVHFPNEADELDTTISFTGCATGISTTDNMIASGGYYDAYGVYQGGTQYRAVWEGVPESVDGVVEVTLRVTGQGNEALEGEMYLDVVSDQGTTRVTVYVEP